MIWPRCVLSHDLAAQHLGKTYLDHVDFKVTLTLELCFCHNTLNLTLFLFLYAKQDFIVPQSIL